MLCTVELVFLMQEIDELHPMDIEDKADEIDYAMDEIREVNYLDPLYGDMSRMTYEEFVNASDAKKSISGIWYDPNMLRNLVFTKVELPIEDKEKATFDAFVKEHKIKISDDDNWD